jgi:hypothetical protein
MIFNLLIIKFLNEITWLIFNRSILTPAKVPKTIPKRIRIALVDNMVKRWFIILK